MIIITDCHGRQHTGEPGAVLSAILAADPCAPDLPCGGRGTCQGCAVRICGFLSPPTQAEIARFCKRELQEGWRLACQTRVLGDARLLSGHNTAAIQVADDGTAPPSQYDPLFNRCGVAVDIGTTTLCARLFGPDGRSSEMVTRKNPQTAFGADVISRIDGALSGQGTALAHEVREGVASMIARLADGQGISPLEIDAAVLAGNTTMLYLLTGQDPKPLSHAPFAADRLFGETLPARTLPIGIGEDGVIYLPRCASAFVGGDITAAVLASGMTARNETALLMDLGTNGELALWHEGNLSVCSTATGPAFEGQGIRQGVYAVPGAIDRVWTVTGGVQWSTIGGGEPVGICGSGIIDALAVMLETGVIDETGAFKVGECFCLGEIAVTAADVHSLQLAKAAVRAGIETLLETVGVGYSEIASLYIAGGFGRFLNLQSAAAIGLLPSQWIDRTRTIGNGTLTGASMLLQSRPLLDIGEMLANSARTIPLDANPVFSEYFMRFLLFG